MSAVTSRPQEHAHIKGVNPYVVFLLIWQKQTRKSKSTCRLKQKYADNYVAQINKSLEICYLGEQQ